MDLRATWMWPDQRAKNCSLPCETPWQHISTYTVLDFRSIFFRLAVTYPLLLGNNAFLNFGFYSQKYSHIVCTCILKAYCVLLRNRIFPVAEEKWFKTSNPRNVTSLVPKRAPETEQIKNGEAWRTIWQSESTAFVHKKMIINDVNNNIKCDAEVLQNAQLENSCFVTDINWRKLIKNRTSTWDIGPVLFKYNQSPKPYQTTTYQKSGKYRGGSSQHSQIWGKLSL